MNLINGYLLILNTLRASTILLAGSIVTCSFFISFYKQKPKNLNIKALEDLDHGT